MWCQCTQCKDINPPIANLIDETCVENIENIYDENFEYSIFDDSENISMVNSELLDDSENKIIDNSELFDDSENISIDNSELLDDIISIIEDTENDELQHIKVFSRRLYEELSAEELDVEIQKEMDDFNYLRCDEEVEYSTDED